MNKSNDSLNYVTQTWVIVFAIIFAPLHAHSQAAEKIETHQEQQLELPFGVKQTGEKQLQLPLGVTVQKDEQANQQDLQEVSDQAVRTFVEKNSSKEEIKAVSPKNLLQRFAHAVGDTTAVTFRSREQIVLSPDGKIEKIKSRPLPVQTLAQFPAESATFYTAMGLMAVAEMNMPGTAASDNPMAIQQFLHHSFQDPVGAIGFYGFMLVNRQGMHFFQQLGVLDQDMPNAAKMKRIKSLFKNGLISQMSMSAGMMAQSLFTEFYHDNDARMCLARWGMKKYYKVVNGAKVQLEADSPEILEACENAYDRWTPTQKFKDYTSSIFAMAAAGLMQSMGVGAFKVLAGEPASAAAGKFFAKAGASKVGMVIRPITMVVGKSGKFLVPQFRMVVGIVNIATFMKLTEWVQPFFDRLVQAPLKVNDLTNVTNTFEKKLAEAAQNKWAAVNYVNREDQRKNDPAMLLKKVGMQYQAFRQFQLQKAYTNYSNWQESLAQFQATYISSYAMYDRFISEVREFKERGNNNRYAGEKPSALFLSRESPVYRVGTLTPKTLRGPLGSDPLKDLLMAIRDYYRQNQKTLTADQDRVLRNLNLGLEAAFRDLSQAELDAAIKKANIDGSKLSAEQRQSIAVELRAKRLDQSLKIFAQVGSNIKNGTGVGFKLKAGIMDIAKSLTGNINTLSFQEFMWNAYTNVNSLVNYSVTVAGFDYYHRELGTNAQIIPEAAREHVPEHYDKAFTPNMADYLLASMVCGPRTNAGARVEKEGLGTKIWNFVTANDEKKESFADLSLVQYNPGFGFTFLAPRLVQDAIGDANLCGRAPKRSKQQNVITGAVEFITGRSVEKQNISPFMYFNVNTGDHVVNGQTHAGFLPLVKFYMNPNFLARPTGDSTPFYNFWTAQVEPQAKKGVLGFQKLYREIVLKDFVPTFVSGEYRTINNRKVHFGAGWSLREEGTYYQDLLGKMLPSEEMKALLSTYKRNLELSIAMFSQQEKVRKATDIILRTMKDDQKAQTAEEEFNEIFEQEEGPKEFSAAQINSVRTAADPAAQAATVILLKSIKANVDAMKALVSKTSMVGMAKSVAQQLVSNMEQVAGEAETYNGVIRAANLQGLPEVSDLQ